MSVEIEVEQLSRNFGEIKAVDDVSFSVGRGEVLGFLGPNGAGKTTTMRMITGFLLPSSGSVRVCGVDVEQDARSAQRRIGYLPENAPLYGEMEVVGLLRFVAEVRLIEPARINQAIDRVVSLCSLEDVVHQRVETLSKGFQRRVGLAIALIHDPEILILDEPTDGLDPNQKHEVRELIGSMSKDKCIILSTHILEEVDAVCSRAVIIARGKIVADAPPDELRRRSRMCGVVTLSLSEPSGNRVAELLQGVDGVGQVEELPADGSVLRYRLLPEKGREILPAVIREVEKHDWKFRDFHLDPGQLDDVFRDITR